MKTADKIKSSVGYITDAQENEIQLHNPLGVTFPSQQGQVAEGHGKASEGEHN